ncbi:DUF4136 domain-containing protein [Gimibacter soli]|uniref:DUF4136 domain-containing protein n=1 Tax=Gimibacter soli TaxID=3024400 RepID=A0AAE9XQU2_9PROT|nr:DUF4136 domain-containing protein [Gimibacter soli]WCL54532.1 DUF4136 domain-containing protein [Gimibacter soli]
MMFKQLKTLVIVAAAGFAAACTPMFRSDVSTFHSNFAPSGQTIALTPMNPDRRDSLEFRQYANMIGLQLGRYGFRQAGDNEPDLIAGFDITINDGREKIETYPSASRSSFWYSRHYWGFWGPYDPFFDTRFHDELRATTVYRVELRVELRQKDGTMLYEGRAETETRSNNLPKLVPLLAEALFEEFPGPNGQTRHVKLDLTDRNDLN